MCECLRGAEALREVAPGRGVGMTARQMQDDAPDRADDADADGQHGLPEAGRLRMRQGRVVGVELPPLQQHVRRRTQEAAHWLGQKRVQLVRPKAIA